MSRNEWKARTAADRLRIVCLSAETADICARLGASDEVVAVSAFAARRDREKKPVIGGFSTCDVAQVAALQPDLVLTFSDVQADFATQLIRRGCTVLATNQRTLPEIEQTIRIIGGAISRSHAGEELAEHFAAQLGALKATPAVRPRVYFEEWHDPLISGIAWVGELIEHCGGEDLFAHRRGKASHERVVTPEEIVAANPQIIIASWCGQPVKLQAIRERPGFGSVDAVRNAQVYALDSDQILQPGPAVLKGARWMQQLFSRWCRGLGSAPHSSSNAFAPAAVSRAG